MWNQKKKAITFSYDDGITQDIRLIELFNKYNLKGTFNLNSELLGKSGALKLQGQTISHNKVKAEDVHHIYAGHEVAVHTLTHAFLPGIADDWEIVRQVEQDRLNLSDLTGYDVVGMAYPCGGQNNDDRTAQIIKEHTGVKYARALETNLSFAPQSNLYRFKGTVFHLRWDNLFELSRRFLEADEGLFYIWGHSYELDSESGLWERYEDFCKLISGREDVFYGTNREVLLPD